MTRPVNARIRIIVLILLWCVMSDPGAAQCYSGINLEKIPQKKVRKYITSRAIDQMDDYSSIHASWGSVVDESDFNIIEKRFHLNDSLATVWKFYTHASPAESWNGESVRFGLLICKKSNSVSYNKDISFTGIDTGQVYFLDLRIASWFFNIPVAFEIITIDPVRQMVEFSYLDDNKSLGKQTMIFTDDGNGGTTIVHRSYFKSDSEIRDSLFYPYFHKRLIKEFHANMKRLIREAKRSEKHNRMR